MRQIYSIAFFNTEFQQYPGNVANSFVLQNLHYFVLCQQMLSSFLLKAGLSVFILMVISVASPREIFGLLSSFVKRQ
jgi:hypothetical protein